MITGSRKALLRRISYALALVALAFFITRQGAAPWIVLSSHWKAFAVCTLLVSAAIFTQALTFIACANEGTPMPSLNKNIRIWATGGLISLIAPFAVGIGVRLTLLKQQGVAVKDSSLATLRQLLINMQFALYGATIATLCSEQVELRLIGLALAAVAVFWIFFKNHLAGKRDLILFGKRRSTEAFKQIEYKRKALFTTQILIMSLNNYCCYNLLGADLSWQESIIVSATTIWSSVFVFIPHGMGVLDTLWIWLANTKGLDTAHATAIALMLRFSFISGSLVILLICAIQSSLQKKYAANSVE